MPYTTAQLTHIIEGLCRHVGKEASSFLPPEPEPEPAEDDDGEDE